MTLERGQIWMMDGGARMPEGRAVLVIQAQALLDAEHPTAIVVPLSTHTVSDAAPLRVRIPAIGKLKRETDAMIDQLRPVDIRSLVKGPLAKVSPALLDSVGEAVRDVLDVTA